MAQTTMQKYFDYVRNRYGDKGVPSNFQHWLDLEKQQIIDAYEVGNNDYANFSYIATNGKDYYNQVYISNSEIPNN